MEYGCVHSFVGGRSTTAETTAHRAAASAHLGFTTYVCLRLIINNKQTNARPQTATKQETQGQADKEYHSHGYS